MEMGDDEIRRATRLKSQRIGGCVTSEELDSYFSDRLPVSRADEIRAHLASCSSCIALARDFRMFADAARDSASAQQPRVLAFARRPLVPLAAAAAVLFGVFLFWRTEPTIQSPLPTSPPVVPTAPPQETVRSPGQQQVLEVITPKGELREPLRTFEWQPLAHAERYEVELRDVDLKILWTASDIRQASVNVPAEVVRALQPGAEYGWRVTAVLSSGPRVTSPLQTFVIR